MNKPSGEDRPAAIGRLRGGAVRPAPSVHAPIALVISRDDAVMRMAAEAVRAPWTIEQSADSHGEWHRLARPGVKLVIIDDLGIDEAARGWLLGQARKHAPDAMIVYIASAHSPDSERRVRAHRVHYYTSRPIDRGRLQRVIASFANAAFRDGRGGG
ncbi:MAG: hypothetical protein ACREQI_06970 [Candidatus Binataceae bacterium]